MNPPVKPTHASLLGKRVFVGLSGGVDSAVSAALLQEEGARVTGVFIKGWYPPGLPCSWAEDRRDAMRVAARLGISFRTLDASAEYKKAVIDYLIHEYGEGRTPNPDIFCNREVKFGAFFNYARKEEADFIAAGHYAKTSEGRLYRGSDETKDQSYFLWAVPKSALTHTAFPLGDMRKEEVRKIAKARSLPVADKRDSQGICFLGAVSIEEFLKAELSVVSGVAKDEKGELVGMHSGAVLYTPGERVALKGAPPGPWFVVGKDMKENLLFVSSSPSSAKEKTTLKFTQTNFFTELKKDTVYEAEYRYHGPKVKGTFDLKTNTFIPTDPLQEPIAEGQSLVMYEGSECIGGGIIAS